MRAGLTALFLLFWFGVVCFAAGHALAIEETMTAQKLADRCSELDARLIPVTNRVFRDAERARELLRLMLERAKPASREAPVAELEGATG